MDILFLQASSGTTIRIVFNREKTAKLSRHRTTFFSPRRLKHQSSKALNRFYLDMFRSQQLWSVLYRLAQPGRNAKRTHERIHHNTHIQYTDATKPNLSDHHVADSILHSTQSLFVFRFPSCVLFVSSVYVCVYVCVCTLCMCVVSKN